LRRWSATLLEAALSRALTLDKFKAVSGILVMVVAIAAGGVAVARHQPANPISWLLATSPPISVHGELEPKHASAWNREGGGVIAGQTLARLRPVAVGALAGVAALLAVASIPLGVLARHGALPSAG